MMASSISSAVGTDGSSVSGPASQIASTSAVTLDQADMALTPVKAEETNNEDAQLFASLVSGMQDGAAAAAFAASSGLLPSAAALGAMSSMKTEDSTPAAPIQAYAKLEFPGFSYYIQTLDVTIGRRPAEFRTRTATEQHITGRSKSAGDVDVDLGPLKSISRFHVRVFYQDQAAIPGWSPSNNNGIHTSSLHGTVSPPFEHGRSTSVSSSGRGSNYELGDKRAPMRGSQGRFVLQVLGRNGACVDDVYVGMGAIVPLGKRTKIQIAERVFYFVLPPAQSHLMGASMGAIADNETLGSEGSLGTSDEDDSDMEDDTSAMESSEQGGDGKHSGKRKIVLKRGEDTPRARAAADDDGDNSKAGIANRKRKRGEPLDEEDKKALKVGTPIGVEALNLNKKKKSTAAAAAASAPQAAVPTPPRAPTGMAAIAIAALAAKEAADAAKAKGITTVKPLPNAAVAPSKGIVSSLASSLPNLPNLPPPMPEMPLPPAGPGIKPDKLDLDLVREAMSSSLANSRGGKLTLHEIYDYLMDTYEYFKNNGRFNGRDWHSGIRIAISRAPIMVRIERKPDEPGYGVFYAFGTSEAAIAARSERGHPLDAPGEISRSPSPPVYPFPFSLPMSTGPTPGGIPYMPSHMHSMIPGMMPPLGMPPMPPNPASMPMIPGPMPGGPGMPLVPSMPSPLSAAIATSKASPMPVAASSPATPTHGRPRPPPTPKSAVQKASTITPATPSQASPASRTAAVSPSIAPDGRVRIVVGKAPPDALAQMASAPKAAITQSIEALFGGPPIVHHEGTLFLSPVVFGKMTAQEINDIGGKGAQQALATLQAQLVAHLQSKMAAGLDPAQSSPSPGPSEGGASKPTQQSKPTVGRPPLVSSAGRPTGGVTARPALGRPSAPGNAVGRPPVRLGDGSARPPPSATSNSTARPVPGSITASSIVRPLVSRPPLGSSVPRPIGAGLGRPGRPPLQRPPSASIARPFAVSSSTSPAADAATGTANSVAQPHGTLAGAASTAAAAASGRSAINQSQSTSVTGTGVRPAVGAPRPVARPGLSRPPLNIQKPMGQAPVRPAAGRPPLSARPRAAVPPVQTDGRTQTASSAARPVPASSAAVSAKASAATTVGGTLPRPAPPATTATTSTPKAAPATAGSPSAPTSSADMAGLLALLAAGKLDSSKLTPAQHELLQRAGRLAAEQQQRAQQQKAAASATGTAKPSSTSPAPPSNGPSTTIKPAN